MSPLRTLRHRLQTGDLDDRSGPPAGALATAARSLTALTRTVAFWLGIVLPFLHVPLLFLIGFTDSTAPALVSLWGLNVVATVVGGRHESGTEAATVVAG